MRVASIDCGTNSIRLLIADFDGSRMTDVDRRMEVVRLGEGVDRTGRLADAALDRTFAATRGYADLIARAGVEKARFVATSASRDAQNAGDFVQGIEHILGIRPEVISGQEEALLSFTGAVRSLGGISGTGEQRVLVFDIGGGSTEFVLGVAAAGSHGRVQATTSVDVGCVRMTERHIRSDPPTPIELDAVRGDADRALRQAAEIVPLTEAATVVGLAGTVTTVAAIAHDLPRYDPSAIHGSRTSAADVHEVAATLAMMTSAQRLSLPVMHPGRADVIVAGALLLSRIMEASGAHTLIASEHDILDGIAWSLLG